MSPCKSLFTVYEKETLLKKKLWHRCFPVKFAKFLRATFSKNTSGRLLLDKQHFLAETASKVPNRQQHKEVIFHFSRNSPLLVKLFLSPSLRSSFIYVGQTPPKACSGDKEKNEMIKSIMKM